MSETAIIFEVAGSPDGGCEGQVLGRGMFTQGDDWADLKKMARDLHVLLFLPLSVCAKKR